MTYLNNTFYENVNNILILRVSSNFKEKDQ
jgi:hypothetical protein